MHAGYGPTDVLKGLSFALQEGEVVAVLGPNGAGKSTLIRVLSGVLKPRAGEVKLDDRPLTSFRSKELALRIAVVPQNEDSVFDFTVREMVAMARYAHDGTAMDHNEAIEVALNATSLRDMASRGMNRLSGGERQRVLFARALAQETPILLLDEPTAHMDVGFQIATLSLVRKLARSGKTVAAAMHDLNLAIGFADRAALIYDGRVVAEGPVQEVVSSEEIERVYGATFVRFRDPTTGRMLLAPDYVPERDRAVTPKRVHVIGGGGSAAALITELWQLGHTPSLGVTHTSDSDYQAASRLGIPAVALPPYTPITKDSLLAAKRLASDAEVVILCPAPFGPGNVHNLILARELVETGKRLLVVARDNEPWDFTPDAQATALLEALLPFARVVEAHSIPRALGET